MENKKVAEWEEAKIHLETLRLIIIARYNIIFTVSMLAAAILVITTFSPEVLSISLTTKKLLVIILLAIIPVSLIDYSLKLSRDANYVMKILDIPWQDKRVFLKKLLDGSSYLYVAIIALIVIFVIYSIIQKP